MPSKNEKQRAAAGAALAAKRGEKPVSELYGASKQMYESMSEKQLREYASKPTKKDKHGSAHAYVFSRAIDKVGAAHLAHTASDETKE